MKEFFCMKMMQLSIFWRDSLKFGNSSLLNTIVMTLNENEYCTYLTKIKKILSSYRIIHCAPTLMIDCDS